MSEETETQRSGLVWLVMAGFCGLIGFVVVYHYANFERPLIRFAIVMDAGSTQTRSSLFTITIDTPELSKWLSKIEQEEDAKSGSSMDDELEIYSRPLNKLLQVKQISSCVNGGPMASLGSQVEAEKLVRKCLRKFTRLIKLLDFEDDDDDDDDDGILKSDKVAVLIKNNNNNSDEDSDESLLLESSEISKQMDILNHHVSSVTHYYLGATAGMRALAQLNETRAVEKLNWVDRALNKSNLLVEYGSPYLNRGYVSIISGSDEAAYGWTSVNFICDKLVARSRQQLQISDQSTEHNKLALSAASKPEVLNSIYNLNEDLPQKAAQIQAPSRAKRLTKTIGTIELGGASAQMAFETDDNSLDEAVKGTFEMRQMQLFNGRYNLLTRSDLCLGMSQAVLRANYILIRNYYEANKFKSQTDSNRKVTVISEIENPCGQNRSRTSLGSTELSKILQGACLVPNDSDSKRDQFVQFISNSTNLKIVLVGTSDIKQCEALLDNLIDSNRCRKYFKLCPATKVSQKIIRAPSDDDLTSDLSNQYPGHQNEMPFVTISGYNHALRTLNLNPLDVFSGGRAHINQLETLISDKLGGRSIDYNEFVNETKSLCSTNYDQLLYRFPKVNKAYQMVICLQLVYIRKLLTDFYGFNPRPTALDRSFNPGLISDEIAYLSHLQQLKQPNWSQIKFLLFTPTEPLQTDNKQHNHQSANSKRDIGWALGLLLNATSQQLGSSGDFETTTTDDAYYDDIFFHHGASVKFALRATLLLMLACCLIGMSMLIAGLIWARENQRNGSNFVNHSSSYVVASSPVILRRGSRPFCASISTSGNFAAGEMFTASVNNIKPASALSKSTGASPKATYGSMF